MWPWEREQKATRRRRRVSSSREAGSEHSDVCWHHEGWYVCEIERIWNIKFFQRNIYSDGLNCIWNRADDVISSDAINTFSCAGGANQSEWHHVTRVTINLKRHVMVWFKAVLHMAQSHLPQTRYMSALVYLSTAKIMIIDFTEGFKNTLQSVLHNNF